MEEQAWHPIKIQKAVTSRTDRWVLVYQEKDRTPVLFQLKTRKDLLITYRPLSEKHFLYIQERVNRARHNQSNNQKTQSKDKHSKDHLITKISNKLQQTQCLKYFKYESFSDKLAESSYFLPAKTVRPLLLNRIPVHNSTTTRFLSLQIWFSKSQV